MPDESDEPERDLRKEIEGEYSRRIKMLKYLAMFITASILIGIFFVVIPVGELIFGVEIISLELLEFSWLEGRG